MVSVVSAGARANSVVSGGAGKESVASGGAGGDAGVTRAELSEIVAGTDSGTVVTSAGADAGVCD